MRPFFKLFLCSIKTVVVKFLTAMVFPVGHVCMYAMTITLQIWSVVFIHLLYLAQIIFNAFFRYKYAKFLFTCI